MQVSSSTRDATRRRTTGNPSAVLEVVKEPKAKILLVEDDSRLLAAFERMLRSTFDVTTATNGQSARNLLEQRHFAAAILDLRLPGVSGCELLTHARRYAPDTVRILISGSADMDVMTTAINDGQLFRFIPKPCTPSTLLQAVTDAIRQYREQAAYRTLLEETEMASVGALVDILAITQPGTMGRPARIREVAENMALELGVDDSWILGIAAQLSLVGYIIVPRDVFLRAKRGVPLSVTEESLLNRLLPFVERLVATVPRFDQVCTLLRVQYDTDMVIDEHTAQLASILQTAIAFEALEDAGLGPASALERLRRSRKYDEHLLEALSWTCGMEPRPRWSAGPRSSRLVESPPPRLRPEPLPPQLPPATTTDITNVDESVVIMPLSEVTKGMRFADDVVTSSGVVLVARGQVVTSGLVDRIGSAWGAFAHSLFVRMAAPGTAEVHASTALERVV